MTERELKLLIDYIWAHLVRPMLKFCFGLAVIIGSINTSFAATIYELLADPDRPYIYASDSVSNSVLFINTSTNKIDKTIFVGSKPTDMDIKNSRLYVAISGGSTIAVIDLVSQTALAPIFLSFTPSSLAVGRADRLYVSACEVGYPDTNEIVVINIETKSEITRFSGAAVHAADSSGNNLYVTDGCGYSFPNVENWDISTDTPTLVQEAHLWGGGCSWDAIPHLKLSADDSKMYLISGRASCGANDDGKLPVFYTSNFAKAGEYDLEYSPIALEISADGNIAYTAHFNELVNATPKDRHGLSQKDIHIFSAEMYTELAVVNVSTQVARSGLAVSTNGKRLFVVFGFPPTQSIAVYCLVESCSNEPPEENSPPSMKTPIGAIYLLLGES